MTEPYDAYVHRFGNLEEPTVELSEDRSRLTVQFDRVPGDDAVEIRYLMDPALFEQRGTQPGFEDLLIDEHEVQNLEHSLMTRRRPEWALLPLLLMGVVGVGITSQYRRVGREPDVQVMKYPFEPPADLPPAAVAHFQDQGFNAGRTGPAFHATIMDLMRRGYGEFVPRRRNKVDIKLDMSEPTAQLLPFELDVLRYLQRAASADGLVTHERLKSYSQSNASSFMAPWGRKVRKWLERQRGGELTTAESRGVARRWAGYAFLAALVPAAGAFFLEKDAMVMMIVGAGALMVCALVALVSLPSWRPEIAQEVAEWNGFKRTLTDYTRMKDAPLDFFRLWDVYYAYAAAMGVAQNYLKTLQRAAPLAGADEAAMVRSATWLGATGSHANVSNLAGLSSSINSLSSALSAASASASSGGSVSGGGGGGGGGSGGR